MRTSPTARTNSHCSATFSKGVYSSLMSDDIPALPKGLSIKQQGESLEAAYPQTGEVHLLFARRNTELLRFVVDRGEKLTLVPSEEDETATEVYFVLDGVLRYDLSSGPIKVSPGDFLTLADLSEPIILEAETHVQLLCLTLQPFFHHLSYEVQELRRLAIEVERKDGYTSRHCVRLQALSYQTGKRLQLPSYRLHYLDYGAYLHDVGKVNVPIEILNKPSPLMSLEWDIVKKHPIFGKEMVEQTFMKEAGPIIEQHHERLDGSGYPYGLSGDEISIEAYIVAVADAYDAMTSNRPYRRAMSHDQAVAELLRFSGQYYPSEVLEAFLEVVSAMKP